MHIPSVPGRGAHASPPARARRGASLAALLVWLAAFLIFCFPFLRDPDATNWVGEDERRAEEDVPFEEDVAYFEEDYELPIADVIADGSEEWFGLESDAFRSSGLVELQRIEPGQQVYELHCAGCHDDSGNGAGPAARFLVPRPRNFLSGIFKFTSTQTGGKPLRKDLFGTVTRGLSGASMPDFRLLPEERRHDVVEYVRYLSMRGEFEKLMLDIAYDDEEVPDPDEIAEIVYDRWDPEEQREIFPTVAETARDQASIDRGREYFLDANRTQCDSCHGETGLGDGVNADAYQDAWGYQLRPRNFAAGVFRVGDDPSSLWRSIATGINGSPMGAFDSNLSGEEIWDVVHYVQSLSEGGAQ